MSAEKKANTGEKHLATNPIAYTNYSIDEVVEAGLVLTGTEIKSIRAQAPNLRDAYVEVKARTSRLEAWITNMHIGPYSHGNIYNHEPTRRRKLLLHAHQIEKLYGAVIQKGMTIIPTKMYLKGGRAKIELGLGKGKKKYDKREDLKKKSAEHEMDVARKQRNR